MTNKTCTKCGESKAPSEFYTGHAKCKPCFLAAQKASKLARTGNRGGRKPGDPARSGKKRKEPKAQEQVAEPESLTRSACFGFTVSLQVEEGGGKNVAIEQTTGEATVTIWLSIAEARDLAAFVDKLPEA